MSSFSKLKQQRKEKEIRSYAGKHTANSEFIHDEQDGFLKSLSHMDVDPIKDPATVEVKPGSIGQASYHPEGLYASLPKDLEIRMNTEVEKGRGIYNLRQRKPGDVLLTTKPHIAVLSNGHLESHCSRCFASGGSLRRCTGCKTLFYCDSVCQKADWLLHKQECAAVQRWMSSKADVSSIPGDAIRCLGRIIWNKEKLGRDSVWAREIDAMLSHRTSLKRDPGSHDYQVYSQLAHAIVHFLGVTSPQGLAEHGMDTAADLVDLVSRFTTNTFTISSPALAPLGAFVSPLAALLNHSCDPNAVIVFPRAGAKEQEPLMHLIALKSISPNEEVLTAYIDTTLPRAIRQKQLRETYLFSCECQLCSPPSNNPVDLREAMFCPKKCGGVCLLPTEENNFIRCSNCRSTVKDTDVITDAVRVGRQGLDKAEALQISNSQKSIQLTTKLIPILSTAGLVPAAHPLLGLSTLNASLLVAHLPSTDPNVEDLRSPVVQATTLPPSHQVTPQEVQEALDEAIRAATRACTGLSQVLPEGHPTRGVALAELGKLLCVDEPRPMDRWMADTNAQKHIPPGLAAVNPSEYPPSGPPRLKLAYDTLIRARSELTIGFGNGKNEGGEIGKSVREMAVNIEKELTIWKEGIRNVVRDSRIAGKT